MSHTCPTLCSGFHMEMQQKALAGGVERLSHAAFFCMQAVAAFLRAHAGEVDKTMLGEYLGHHEDFEVTDFFFLFMAWSAMYVFRLQLCVKCTEKVD